MTRVAAIKIALGTAALAVVLVCMCVWFQINTPSTSQINQEIQHHYHPEETRQ